MILGIGLLVALIIVTKGLFILGIVLLGLVGTILAMLWILADVIIGGVDSDPDDDWPY